MPTFVMVGLVPTIQLSATAGVRIGLDPRDKPEDDNGGVLFLTEDYPKLLLRLSKARRT